MRALGNFGILEKIFLQCTARASRARRSRFFDPKSIHLCQKFSLSLKSTQAGQPRMAYPATKRLLTHIFALYIFKTSLNAMKYCNDVGPKTQNLRRSQFASLLCCVTMLCGALGVRIWRSSRADRRLRRSNPPRDSVRSR